MVDAEDIESEVPNRHGEKLLRFGNGITNLDQVAQVDRVEDGDRNSIVILFANGIEREFKYPNRTRLEQNWQIFLHCVENNLYSVKPTPDFFRRWDKHTEQAILAERNAYQ
ncbi:hypothetical protein HKK58_05445 [Pseudomonas sp. ADAK22]|uniref:hypothetical protein n=1 Tax=Pseudomonas sp. ADAK22 TaxID=2730851 RepID=UPI0014648E32|nr:hypothetical protein [Pseudomonas sp. ADAK22]QJI11995.1 hypothetical protein HKK58_05445 [Pseudomonas sp. ADAK22]